MFMPKRFIIKVATQCTGGGGGNLICLSINLLVFKIISVGVLHRQPKDVPGLWSHHQPAPFQEGHGHVRRQQHRCRRGK